MCPAAGRGQKRISEARWLWATQCSWEQNLSLPLSHLSLPIYCPIDSTKPIPSRGHEANLILTYPRIRLALLCFWLNRNLSLLPGFTEFKAEFLLLAAGYWPGMSSLEHHKLVCGAWEPQRERWHLFSPLVVGTQLCRNAEQATQLQLPLERQRFGGQAVLAQVGIPAVGEEPMPWDDFSLSPSQVLSFLTQQDVSPASSSDHFKVFIPITCNNKTWEDLCGSKSAVPNIGNRLHSILCFPQCKLARDSLLPRAKQDWGYGLVGRVFAEHAQGFKGSVPRAAQTGWGGRNLQSYLKVVFCCIDNPKSAWVMWNLVSVNK